MCTISGTCGCQRGLGSFLLAFTGRALWELLKALAQAVQLLLLAVFVAVRWGAPRVYRLARRGYREGRRRWLMRPVVLDPRPAAALPEQPTAMTLTDLLDKQEANA
ncbi:hypothetical protein [Micromonospora sp. NPDC023644]|uniref:hypothetical protein n=1 Tax=Micromonospora sp. NPDC023644 TaxID=3154321 RepID=UPI0033E209E3